MPIVEDLHRTILIAGGEGAGKSYLTAAMALALYPAWRLAYVVGPKYQSARPEFDYLARWLTDMREIESSAVNAPASGAASIKLPYGNFLQTISAEDGPNAITGTGKSPDLVLLVEAGKVPYEIYLACRNRVGRTKGLLIISGTFEGSVGWYPEYFERWQADNAENAKSFSLPTWSNTDTYPGGRDDPEIKLLERINPPDYFQERFGAKPCKPQTLVFKDFSFTGEPTTGIPGNVLIAPYWKGDATALSTPVELAIDPGYRGAYAILPLQRINGVVYQIDEVYERGKVTEEMIGLCRTRPWWKLWNNRGVIDVAALQHQGLPSVVEEWRRLTGAILTYQKVGIVEGIRRTRTFLRNPFTGTPFYFVDPRATNTIWEFSQGYKYKEMVDGRPTYEEPIDANNHAVKALAYYLYARFGPADATTQKLKRPKKQNPWRRLL